MKTILLLTASILFCVPVIAADKAAPRPIDKLGTAIGMGNQKLFTTLLTQIKNVDEELNPIGETALTLAAYNNHSEMVEMLLKKGANVNHQTKNGYSALIFNAMAMNPPAENAIRTAKVLLKAGADKRLKNSDGDTAYSLAIKKHAPELAEVLK